MDAVIVDTPGRQHSYTLQGAEQRYRVMVEAMSEGAVTTYGTGIEETLKRANRALRMLNVCNGIIVQGTEELPMINDMCHAMVDTGDYRLAWVGYAEHDDAKSVRPIAQANGGHEYVENVDITWADTERGLGPTSVAIRTGQQVIARDTETQPGYEAWRRMARESGFRSSAAMPLRADHDVFGAMMICSDRAEAFDEEEALLLTEMANDMAFAISSLRYRRSRDSLAAIVDSAIEAIVGRGVDGSVTSWNKAAEVLFGYSAAEIMGQPVDILVPHEIAGEGNWLLERVVRGETVEQFDTIRLARSGRRVQVSLTISSIRDATGNVVSTATMMHDNTFRNNALAGLRFREHALRMEAAKLRSILDTLVDAVIVADKDGKIIEFNPASNWTHGVDVIPTLAEAWAATCGVYESDCATPLPSERNPLLRAIQGEDSNATELCIRRTDGIRRMSVNGRAIRADDGSITGGLIVLTDITEAIRTAERLHQIALYTRGLFEANLDPLVTISADGKVTDVNKASEDVTGVPRDRLIGGNFGDHHANPEEARAALLRTFRDGTVIDQPLKIRHVSGTVTDILFSATTYRDDTNNIIGVLAAAHDVTSRRQLEAELNQSRRLEAIGHLSAGVAHDFNNILQGIMAYLELLGDELDVSPAGREYIGSAVRLADKAGELTQSLLSYSRKQLLHPGNVGLGRFLSEFRNLVSRTLDPRIRIDVVTEPGLASIWADANYLQSALLNLAINARDAMRAGGNLRIEAFGGAKGGIAEVDAHVEGFVGGRLHQPGGCAVIRVSDTGIGIAPENLARVCEPFFTTKGVQGTGLGLSSVLGFVKQSGGDLRITSELGKGTQVEIWLPLASTNANEPASSRQ